MKNSNEYLTTLDERLQISNSKKEKIDVSINPLKKNIWGLLQDQIKSVKIFGSYERNTMLSVDESADVDVAVVFKQNDFEAVTYLKRIREMCESIYTQSTIYRDYPTIVVELEHIRFEITPSYFYSEDIIKIPAKLKKEFIWESTSPIELRNKVLAKDKNNNGMILPVIRILKYWNIKNGKLFRSYLIEKYISEKSYSCRTIRGYFNSAIGAIGGITMNEEQRKCYLELKERSKRLGILEENKLIEYIEQEFNFFLPLP